MDTTSTGYGACQCSGILWCSSSQQHSSPIQCIAKLPSATPCAAHRSRSSTARSMAVAKGCHSSNVITCKQSGRRDQPAACPSLSHARHHACTAGAFLSFSLPSATLQPHPPAQAAAAARKHAHPQGEEVHFGIIAGPPLPDLGPVGGRCASPVRRSQQ